MFIPQGTLIHLAYTSGGSALVAPIAGELGLRQGWNLHSIFGKRGGGNRRKTNFFSQINVHAFNIRFTLRQAVSGICQQNPSEQNAAMIISKEWWRDILAC